MRDVGGDHRASKSQREPAREARFSSGAAERTEQHLRGADEHGWWRHVGAEHSRLERSEADGISAAQAAPAQDVSGNDQLGRLSALVQRAERLAVIDVPRELVRLQDRMIK